MKPIHFARARAALLVLTVIGAPMNLAASEKANFPWPHVEEVSFTSATFGRTATYIAVVPPGLPPTDRPVLFFLHGRGRNQRSLVDVDALRNQFLDAPFVTILPYGEDGWYQNSPVNPTAAYGDLLDEIILSAEQRYRLSSVAAKRAITGWSMGGYGAATTAIRRPGDFGTFSSIIGLLDFPREETLPKGQNYTVPARTFGEDPEIWPPFNPANHAAAFAESAVLLVIGDSAFDRTMNENFLKALDIQEIDYEAKRLSGGHTFSVVQMAVPIVIEFTAENLPGKETHP